MTDVYRDTDERYQRDPAFAVAVQMLESMAQEHGFTPGELKQIAFKAALNIEERRDRQIYSASRDDRPCADCGGPVSPLLSYIGATGKRYCGRDCYVRGGR